MNENKINPINEEIIPTEDKEQTIEKSENSKSLMSRLCGELKPDSLRSSILGLSIVSLGLGCMSLPKKYEETNVLFMNLFLILATIINYMTLDIVFNVARRFDKNKYSDVIGELCGTIMLKIYNITTIVYIGGIIISYQIVTFDIIGTFIYSIHSFGYSSISDFNENGLFSQLWFRIVGMIGYALVILLPMNFLKDVSKLRFTSLLGLFSLLMTLIVIAYQLPDFINKFYKDNPDKDYKWTDFKKESFEEYLSYFTAIATIFFATAPHFAAFPVFDRLYNHNKRRTRKFTKISLIINFFMYMCVGTIGYLTQPIKTPSIVVKRDNLNDEFDYPITICRLFVIILLSAKTPVVYNSFRISIINIVFSDDEITFNRNLVITLSFTIISALIGALYAGISQIISFLGGLCAVLISYFFPAIIYLSYKRKDPFTFKKFLIIVICGGLCIIGFIAAGLSLRDILQGKGAGH